MHVKITLNYQSSAARWFIVHANKYYRKSSLKNESFKVQNDFLTIENLDKTNKDKKNLNKNNIYFFLKEEDKSINQYKL